MQAENTIYRKQKIETQSGRKKASRKHDLTRNQKSADPLSGKEK